MARSLSALSSTNRKLRQRVKVHASQILLQITTPLDDAVIAHDVDEDHRVTIVVNPVNRAETPQIQYPGVFLSSMEMLIWNALGDGQMVARDIAAKIGREHDTKLKYMLLNLEDRGVLVHEDNRGYQRAPVNNGGKSSQPDCR